jgi:hypothetical protein
MTIEVPLNAYEAGKRGDFAGIITVLPPVRQPMPAGGPIPLAYQTAEAARRAVYAPGFAAFAAAAPIATAAAEPS